MSFLSIDLEELLHDFISCDIETNNLLQLTELLHKFHFYVFAEMFARHLQQNFWFETSSKKF